MGYETGISSSSNEIVVDLYVYAFVRLIVSTYYDCTSFIDQIICGCKCFSLRDMRHDVVMETDILRCIDTYTDWSEIVDDVVSKLNIIRVLDVDGPTEAVVD